MSSTFFNHPITGHLIKKMRVYLVTPASVNEYAFHGIGRVEGVSGFTFDSSQNPASMYQEALEQARKQLSHKGMLVIVIDPSVMEWTPSSRQTELMSSHEWRVVILRILDSDKKSSSKFFQEGTNITVAEVAADHLDQTFAALNEMTLALDRSIYPTRGLVFH